MWHTFTDMIHLRYITYTVKIHLQYIDSSLRPISFYEMNIIVLKGTYNISYVKSLSFTLYVQLMIVFGSCWCIKSYNIVLIF